LRDQAELYQAWEKAWEHFPERYPLVLREFPSLDALLDAEGFGAASRELYADMHSWISVARAPVAEEQTP
ncbi:MAG TPA: hypothetical protein H9854_02660, partial [Candidatus Halomonas stercoripullorum]|nr:hypothetical protein [Candidatus Halomonas stercoripullorum]